MKKRLLLLIIMMLCLVLTACAGSGKSKDSESEQKESEKGKVNQEEKKKQDPKEEQLYNELFNIDNIISVQIEISDDELAKIQQDYKDYKVKKSKSPIYRMAEKVTITVGDEVCEIEEVGIRLKGNTTREPIYDEESGDLNLSHYRLSFNETFDDPDVYKEDAKVWSDDEKRKERKNRTFATLKGLELKWNNNYDNTNVREYYAYSMFRENGILAPQNTIASLGMNNVNYGVYKVYEPVDKIFIERNLKEEDWGGDLYKCAWTHSPANYTSSVTYGVEDENIPQFYNYDLKTNKSSSDHASLQKLLEVVNDNSCSEEQFESVIDTDYLGKFLAISYFAGNPDDMRNNYNNHYLYFCKSTGKAIFIPYDYDRCLGLTRNWNPDHSGMTAVSPFSDKAAGNSSKQKNPIIKLALLDKEYCLDAYKNELETIADGKWLRKENFDKVYQKAKTNYEQLVKPDYQFADADISEFYFSEDGEFVTNDQENMSVEEYFNRILETYHNETKN